MRNSDNISQVSLISEQGYVFSLEREITLLKEENDTLKKELEEVKGQDLPAYRAAERERIALIGCIQQMDENLKGIPAIVKIIREVLRNLVTKIESGDHVNIQMQRRFKK